MNFTAFDTSKIDEYAKQAKEYWGDTPEFKEFEAKEKKEKQRGNKNAPSTTHADFCRIWQGKITTQRFS